LATFLDGLENTGQSFAFFHRLEKLVVLLRFCCDLVTDEQYAFFNKVKIYPGCTGSLVPTTIVHRSMMCREASNVRPANRKESINMFFFSGKLRLQHVFLAGVGIVLLLLLSSPGGPSAFAASPPPRLHQIDHVSLHSKRGVHPATIGVGTQPYAVAEGDFNGDGHLDLVTANDGSNTVSVLLGRGDGTFAPQVTYPVGNSPLSVAVGDFTGDGHLDLAVANDGSDTVSVLLGRGDGTFAPQVGHLPRGFWPRCRGGRRLYWRRSSRPGRR
jgi:hypothetical protein